MFWHVTIHCTTIFTCHVLFCHHFDMLQLSCHNFDDITYHAIISTCHNLPCHYFDMSIYHVTSLTCRNLSCYNFDMFQFIKHLFWHATIFHAPIQHVTIHHVAFLTLHNFDKSPYCFVVHFITYFKVRLCLFVFVSVSKPALVCLSVCYIHYSKRY